MKMLQRHNGPRLQVNVLAAFLCMAVFSLSPAPADAASSMHGAVREYIETHMPWPQGTIRVDFLSGEPDPATYGKKATFRIEAAGNFDFIGNAAFIVRVYSGGTLTLSETVRTRIEVLRDMLVTTKMIGSGAILTNQDVRVVKKWTGRNMPDTLSSPEEAIGKRMITQARPGTELTARMLKDAPLVRKGQMVRVLFDSASMRISTVGMPEEDGVAGSMIRVRNMTSKKIIYARVLGNSLVGVDI